MNVIRDEVTQMTQDEWRALAARLNEPKQVFNTYLRVALLFGKAQGASGIAMVRIAEPDIPAVVRAYAPEEASQ